MRSMLSDGTSARHALYESRSKMPFASFSLGGSCCPESPIGLIHQGKGCEKIPQDVAIDRGRPTSKPIEAKQGNFDPTPYVSSFETQNNLSQAHKSCLYIDFTFNCVDMHLCICIFSDVCAHEEPAGGPA